MNTDINQMLFLVLHIGEAHCDKDWNYKNVCSPFTRMYYITEGHAQIIFPDKVQDLRPRHMYIIPAFTPHSYACQEKFSHCYIHVYNEADHDILEDWELPTEIKAGEDKLALIHRLRDLCPKMELTQSDPLVYDNSPTMVHNILRNKQRELYARIESRGIVYLLLANFLQTAHLKQYIQDKRIRDVLAYIHSHLHEKPNIDKLAEVSCLSKDHLIRIFRKEMNTTPLAYINRKKMKKAQLKLLTETFSVKEIAYHLGFDNQAYFNRIFKKTTGLTPMAYKRRAHDPL